MARTVGKFSAGSKPFYSVPTMLGHPTSEVSSLSLLVQSSILFELLLHVGAGC